MLRFMAWVRTSIAMAQLQRSSAEIASQMRISKAYLEKVVMASD